MKDPLNELKQFNRVRKIILQRLETEARQKSPQEIETELENKLKITRVSRKLHDKLKALWKISKETTSTRTRLLCLGALLYFINPLDFIPDLLVPFGLADDLAVLTLALRSIKDDFLKDDETSDSRKN